MYKVVFNGKKWELITDEEVLYCAKCKELLKLPVYFCPSAKLFFCEGCEIIKGTFGDGRIKNCVGHYKGNDEHAHIVIREARLIKSEKVAS
jgi:hypothetical protein